jgi:uncharacterized protein (TIGR02594 family)
MARSTTAKSPKAAKAKSASRAKGLITAANLAGIGSVETFTIIRELHDRLAQQGKDVTAEARVAMTKAAPLEAAAAADLNTPWVTVARGELGQRDYPGPFHNNPRILEYLKTTGQQTNADETSWCSAFVNWCMRQAGKPGTNNAAARSWLSYGQALGNPRPGCIVVLWRESPSSWKGHVGFFDGWDIGNRIRLLAGNQGGGVDWDEVCVTSFPQERVLGYRWPLGG